MNKFNDSIGDKRIMASTQGTEEPINSGLSTREILNKTPVPEATRIARRQFLKLSAMFTAAGALPLLDMAKAARAAEPDAPLRIGYLPITDATPLLVAHHNGLFEQQGLKVEQPRLF